MGIYRYDGEYRWEWPLWEYVVWDISEGCLGNIVGNVMGILIPDANHGAGIFANIAPPYLWPLVM